MKNPIKTNPAKIAGIILVAAWVGYQAYQYYKRKKQHQR